MAEGWAHKLKGDVFEAYSAGFESGGLDRRAVQVMLEAGVDISGQKSKVLDEVKTIPFDFAVTVCGSAHERCPVFTSGAKVIHIGFDDPPVLAQAARTEEEALIHYRRVRDEIRQFVESLPDALLQRTTISR